ncbi:MAG: DNA internalization-related competence protein ComEC/Rec2 [Lachnospiraceae bacterium]|nr:DNA internalization-related competence protein ComEC/Rec2 [Lachnospiraceae bacterium]
MKRTLFCVCLCLILVACLRLFMDEDAPRQKKEALSGKTLMVSGRIYQKEKDKFYLTSVIVHENAAILQQENSKQAIEFKENLMCEYEGSERLKLGSNVTVLGDFTLFSKATNPGEFDSRAYYASIKIAGCIKQTEILAEGERYSEAAEILYRMKQYWKERLYQIFPQKEASVMCTMLLGEKGETNLELKALYKRNGIVHILSISGLHITIIGISLYQLLRKSGVPTCVAAVIGGSILLLYGALTGMSISATRAIGMYLLKMLSHICGRTYDMLTALGIMGAVMVLQNPEYLYHAGFLLSFCAVLGIGVLYPALTAGEIKKSRVFQRKYHGRFMNIVASLMNHVVNVTWQSFLSGVSVTLTTLPVMLWFYYEVPVYSMLLNLLTLPFMGMVLCFGLVAMLLPGFGILGTVDCFVLAGYERLCKVFEGFPLHTWNPGQPKAWQVVVYYVIWIMIVCLGNIRKKRKAKDRVRYIQVLQIALLTTAVIFVGIRDLRTCEVTFLDVGQGDCICVQSVSGETYLFDCGSSSRDEVGRYVLLPFLKYSGIRKLDGVFVSHDDSDHKNGVEELLTFAEQEGIEIERVYWPGEMSAGVQIESETSSVLCLHPSKDFEGEDNASSQCFYVELLKDRGREEKLTLLLTGDVDGEGEEMLTDKLRHYGIGGSAVLKVAHHGSKYATSERFLRQYKPQVSVVSCGRYNSYGHPHKETLKRLQENGSIIFTTPECGAVTISLGKEIEVRTFRPLR